MLQHKLIIQSLWVSPWDSVKWHIQFIVIFYALESDSAHSMKHNTQVPYSEVTMKI
jgi:hypothetical protein